MLPGKLYINAVDQLADSEPDRSPPRILIGQTHATTDHDLPQWMSDILDLIGEGCLIDDDLMFRVVVSFGITETADTARGAWVAIWQFLRMHEGKLALVTIEPERSSVEEWIAIEAAQMPDAGATSNGDTFSLWTTRQALLFLLAVWVASSALIPVLLLLRQYGFLSVR